jgi:FKBP-type peptidyl-prolyl cis-trans isomerase
MRGSTLAAPALALGLALPIHAAAGDLETDEQKILYALGVSLSQNLTAFDFTAEELAVIQAGLLDGARRLDPRVPMEQIGPQIDLWLRDRTKAVAARESAAGEAVLAAAAAEPGAERFPSGLVYRAVESGHGASPAATDTVRFHYRGTLRDGTVFDTSLDGADPQPVAMALSQSIACFREGLAKMRVGGRSKLTCPAGIAYGERGSPPRILPGAVLTFDVELVGIVARPSPAAPPAP